MRKVDLKSVSFAAEWYKENVMCGAEKFTVSTSSTETFDCDMTVSAPECGEYHVEVKTKNCPYNKWSISTTGSCLLFDWIPEIEYDIQTVANHWHDDKPTQADLDEVKRNEKEKGERVRWFCLNAASGEHLLFGNTFGYAPIKPPKWLSMYNDERSELVIIFADGVLRFDHQQLLDAQVSYGYLKTWGSEEYYHSNDKYWQFKIFLDIDKGTFYPCDVPQGVLPKPKKYK